MRRMGNTSFSPAIGTLIAGTSKIGFWPDSACAEPLVVVAPANASAPEARTVLRSTISMGCSALLPIYLSSRRYLAPAFRVGKPKPGRDQLGGQRARDEAGPWLVDDGLLTTSRRKAVCRRWQRVLPSPACATRHSWWRNRWCRRCSRAPLQA